MLRPGQHCERNWIVVEPHFGQTILAAQWPELIRPSSQHTKIDEPIEALRQDIRRDSETACKVVEPAGSQEALADHERAPAIAANP